MKKILVLLGIIAILVAIPVTYSYISATSGENPNGSQNVTVSLAITRGFGNEILLMQEVELDGGNAMNALEKAAAVDTKYGGAFVEAINGIKNSYPKNWFYYMNGLLADRGATAYTLQNGDMEQWDYHSYASSIFIDAVIGHFPQPFLSGYGGKTYPTVVVYQQGFQTQAEALKERLDEFGVQEVAVKGTEELTSSEKEGYNLILIGAPDHPLIAELNGEHQKYKLPVYFEQGKIVALNLEGGEAQFSTAGLIEAIKNPWNPKWIPGTIGPCENVVWIISGTTEQEVREACNLVAGSPESFAYACAAVICDNTVLKVP